MRLQDRPYRMIESGRKTVEIRLWDEKRRLLSVGDEIEFQNASDPSLSLLCRVLALHRFDSFCGLYASLDLLQCGYTEQTVASASPRDMAQYYSEEEERKYGVVGIELRLCR